MPIAPNRTSTTSLTALLPQFWSTSLIENLYPNLYYWQFGTPKPLPRNFGNTIKFPRMVSVTRTFPQVAAASEGGAIGTSMLSATSIEGTLRQFAFAYRHTDVVLMTALSDVVDLSVKEIGRQAALNLDTIFRDTISAHGVAVFGGATALFQTSVKTTHILKSSDLLRGAVRLDALNNPRPADGHYPLITHPLVLHDLQASLSTNAWLEVNKYNPAEVSKIYRGEMGRIFGVKVVASSNVKRLNTGLSTAASGYRSTMFAPDAVYTTTLEGSNAAEIILKPLGSGGTSDPANQIATVAAKMYFAVVPVVGTSATDQRIARLVHGSKVL